MATIKEVAERAGVSLTTVSHVINNTRFVSDTTRQRVVNAMEALNYRPNALARSLRSGKTTTIGLILPDSSNPFFAEIGHAIEDTAFKLGYSVILCNTESDPDKEEFYVDVLSKKQVDGVIFVATGDNVDPLNLLFEQEIPVVIVDRDLPDGDFDAVLVDNRSGGYQATQHLIELGHQRIACITGPSNLTPSAERITGYYQALEEAGIPVDESLVLPGEYHPRSGLQAALRLLKFNDPPTAIFAFNDLMAIGAIRAASTRSLRIPQDLAVVGFDNIELTLYTTPPLTTIAQPIDEIGRQAVTLLVQRIEDPNRETQRLVLPTRLIPRGSTSLNDTLLAEL